ncbi:MAG: phage holin family protein [Bacteroidota bacterium]
MDINKPLVKTLAWVAVPFKVIDKGIDNAKNGIKEEIHHFEAKYKVMALIGACFLLFVMFFSITLGLLLSAWLENYIAGFSILTGLYFILAVTLLIVYKQKILP